MLSKTRSRPSPLRRACLRALALASLPLAACRGEGEPASPWTEARLGRMTVRQKAAQLVAARAVAPRPGELAADSPSVRLLRRAREGVGAVELSGGGARGAAELVRALREVPLPPLVLLRAERGPGERLAGAVEAPPPAALALAGDAEGARLAAEAAAADARAVGVDLLVVPGPPLPSGDAGALSVPLSEAAAEAYAAYGEALGEGGVRAGWSVLAAPSADTVAPVVGWDRAALEASQLGVLRAAAEGGAGAMAPGYVALPALTGDSAPLPFSGVALEGLLRRDLGFAGVVVVDVDSAGPLARRFGEVGAAVAAVRAGADLVLGASRPAALADSLAAAVVDGRIPRARLDEAVRRVFAAKEAAGLGLRHPEAEKDTAAGPPPVRTAETVAKAAEAHARALRVLGAAPERVIRGCRKLVLLADPRADAAVAPLAEALRERVPTLLRLNSRVVAQRGPLSSLSDFAGNDAECVVAAGVPGARPALRERVVPPVARDTAGRDTGAAARADSAAFARDTAARRIVYVSLAPTEDEAPPAAPSVVVAWGVGREAQRAAAAAVLGTLEVERGEEVRPVPVAWPPAPRLARALAAEAGMSADSLARIDRAMRAALDTGVFTGAVVAVGRKGKLVKLTGYGRTAGVPVDPAATVFDIASLTKVVGTTAAIMALVEDGQVRLDAPVRRYIPQFRGDGKGGVTIRHLLTHTSGLPAGAWLYGETSNPDEALRRVYRTALVRDPGSRVEYSDFGMILLAEVARRRAGEPIDRFLARRVFVPLGMAHTLYLPPVALQAHVVPTALRSERPYTLDGVVHDGNAFRLGGVAGHAGLFSTAADLAVYAQTLLNGGAYGTRRIWRPSTVRSFTARQPGAGTRTLGWDTPAPVSSAGSYLSATAFGHTGYTGTSIWIDPARELFVILLTNRTYDRGTSGQILDLRRAVANAATRAITDTPIRPRPGTPEAIREEQQRRRPKPTPRRPQRPRNRRRG